MKIVTPATQAAIIAAIAFFFAGSVCAQYFGQNKVRFKDMDFQVLETEHFDVYYYPEEREATVLAGKMAERWYARFSNILQHELPANQPVILYDSGPAFRQTTVIPGDISVGTGGVTEGLRRRVIMPFAGPLADTDHVLGHELVHAFQYDMTSGPGNSAAGGVPGAATLPLWFIEGMAEYLSVGPVDPNTAMWLRDALQRDKLPNWDQLDNPDYFPYRFGQAFWTYVAGLYGDRVIGEMLRAAGRAASAGAAVRSQLGMEPEALVERWHAALRDAYTGVISRATPVEAQAMAVIEADEDGRSLNVSPSVSPDGRRMVIFSERSLFAIDLYVVDTQTGEVQRKLTESAVDPHLSSLEFIQSAGAWDADGTRFVFPTVKTGIPHLAIYNMNTGDRTDEIEIRDVGEIYSPTWSPDGRRILFSAIAGGLLDLFVYDLEAQQLTRITNDAFAELHPSWSPDGRFVVFSTDRFGTNLDDLTYELLRLARLEVRSGNISELPSLPQGKHIDPQWADNQTLYFVSDNSGISNVYRLNVNTGETTQITDLQTGVSGIAPLSPALGVARNANRVLFSVFRDGMYGVYSFNAQSVQPRQSGFSFAQAATLPPLQRTENAIAEAQARPPAFLPTAANFSTKDYDPNLSLAYIAPPSIGVGVSSYGSMVGGGTAIYWSDMLEQHQVMTSFQSIASTTGNVLRNVSAMGGYENRSSRWTWGFLTGQVPYQISGYDTGTATIDGQPVILEQATTIWQIERQAVGLLAYPFNRATRVEFSGGYRNVGFAAEAETAFYDPFTGQFLGSQTQDLDAPSGLHMGTASAALVYDTSIFGGTSPVIGRRFRFEAGSQAGSLNYQTLLGDFRQYFRLPGNLSFAFRGLHFGRYGGGAENDRLQDLSLAYPALIRGYSVGSFTAQDCGPGLQTDGSCPAFDQLTGSRIAVGNAELRIPLIGTLGLIPSRGYPPIEIAPFFDAAYAWRSNERIPFFQDNSRDPVRSYGGSLRANVLGYFVAQISYVKPMDRFKGWHWEFAILPGF